MSGITIRSIRLHDLVRLGTVRTEALSLDQPLGRVGQRIADPLSVLPISNRRRKTFVALCDGRPEGIAELRVDPENHRWILTRLAANRRNAFDDVECRERIWKKLIVYAIRSAGFARAKRMHASFPEGSPLIPVLEETGFTVYARDTVLVAHRLPTDGDTVARRQEPSDVWSIQQLYHAVTPRAVQYAEALTSNYWDLAVPGSAATRGYVIDHGFEIAGYCRVVSAGGRHVMNVMVHPDAVDLLGPLLSDVARDLNATADDEFVLSVPEYHQEYLDKLALKGFQVVGNQVRTVKYTAVPRRLQVASVEELAKAVPKGVAAGTPILLMKCKRRIRSRSLSAPNATTLRIQ